MTPRLLLFALTCLAMVFASVHAESSPATSGKPNIVFILADDLGWMDTGFQGSEFFETPNIDRLARQSMIFTSAYAAAGNCAPSRACLISGSYTPRHQLYAVKSTDRGPKKSQRLVPIPNSNGLPGSFFTLAEALKSGGYATGHFGKWHLDGKNGAPPSKQGFDVTFDSFGEGILPEGTETNKQGPPSDAKGVFTLTRLALEFIEANRDRPFFCYLAHHAPHDPVQSRPETLARFKAKKSGMPPQSVGTAACVYDLDASIGLLMDKLEALGLDQNTMVVFTSDNGPSQRPAEPLRGYKGSYYEGGIRVPMIVRWPGIIKPGSRNNTPTINVDFYPTFLAMAGIPAPAAAKLDGESLLPLLRGDGALRRESVFWHFPGYLDHAVTRGRKLDVATGFRSRPVSVINKGQWKLHLYHEEWQLDGGRAKIDTNNAVELYDLSTDVGEHVNLAQKNPAKRDELLDDLLKWIHSSGALLASSPNPKYELGAVKIKGGEKKAEPLHKD